MLNRQVPLIINGRLHVLIPHAEDRSLEASEIRAISTSRRRNNDAIRGVGCGQSLVLVERLEFAASRAAVKWWVDRQTEVCAGSFQIVGNGEGAAKYGLTVESSWRPGKSEPWLECPAAVHAV